MSLFRVELWAVWCGFGLLVMAAVANTRTHKVPNRLTLPATIAGWFTALLVTCSVPIPSDGGGLFSSLAAGVVAFFLLLPLYATDHLGAGCVKMQAAFGAWIGCALPPLPACTLVGLGTLVGGVLSLAGALAMTKIVQAKQAEEPGSRLFDPELDVGSSVSSPKLSKEIGLLLFPAQATLSLGSICGVAVPLAAGWL